MFEVARAAVTALQVQAAAAGSTSWVEVVQRIVSGIGLGCIVWGLF